MFGPINSLKLIDIIDGISGEQRDCRGKAYNSFVFKLTGESRYDFRNQIVDLKAGEMLFVPQGSFYTVRKTSQGESRYVSIHFDAALENAQPRLYPFNNYADMNYICNHLVRLWLFRSPSDEYKCISYFYDLLSKLCTVEDNAYRDRRQLSMIEPAVEYLKAHIFDCSLKAHKLHLLCGISDTYFRKIFISQFGTSPQKYLINKRLTQAKTLIEDGAFDSISKVAMSVGYEDALYFSRAFKERYGISPSNMAKQ